MCSRMPVSHAGDKISVKYTGWLSDKHGKKMQKFDSNEESGRVPFEFTLGKGVVLKGWDAGLVRRLRLIFFLFILLFSLVCVRGRSAS